MSLLEILFIGLGGFFGASIRYFISTKLTGPTGFPNGTLFVNLLGCLLIGLVLGMDMAKIWTLLVASGFAGSLTTFSTMNKELIVQWKSGQKQSAIVYLMLSYTVGIILTTIGYLMGSLI